MLAIQVLKSYARQPPVNPPQRSVFGESGTMLYPWAFTLSDILTGMSVWIGQATLAGRPSMQTQLTCEIVNGQRSLS